jgi:DNA polymerase V
MFALVDCNNFYVSCERAFQNKLKGIPVVVLSNNDGCIISRSQEAKAIGIKMGAPYFKVKPLLEEHGARVFSSNYALYGDMSRRVMHYLSSVAPDIEIYSIDEAFLDLRGMERYCGDLVTYAAGLKAEVFRRTHIPTCVGIAPTKTLAKLANQLTKKNPALGGICYLDTAAKRQWALEQIAVEDVWGIGRQYAIKMHEAGVHTAAALARCSEAWVRKHLGGVVGARLVRELQGIPCYAFQPHEAGATTERQSIACTRSFGAPLSTFVDLLGAVGTFASRAAEKLRRQGSVANTLTVFISQNKYGTAPPPYTFSTVITLPEASADTSVLLSHACHALKRIWQARTAYVKAGVVLSGLETAGQQSLNLFTTSTNREARTQLLQGLDQINQRFGSGTVRFATASVPKGEQQAPWLGKADFKSAAYTTNWEELWAL